MSSVYVRDEIKTYFAANSVETLVDLSGENRTLKEITNDYSIGFNDDWIAISFIGASEEPISIATDCYREFGSVFFHIVAPIKNNGIDDILNRCETIRSIFRGKRINDIIITTISPPTTDVGTTLDFDNGFTSASFIVDYQRDL